MIEISDRQYWRSMRYYDGILYCSILDIDGDDNWRMITSSEYDIHEGNISEKYYNIWFAGDDKIYDMDYADEMMVIPVRDI